MNTEYVIRYILTYVGENGLRTLACSAQGRHTYPTAEQAQAWLDSMLENNSRATLSQIFGNNPQFEIRACECYPGHFDPVGVYFN